MSIPYLVHKDDAEDYDERQKEYNFLYTQKNVEELPFLQRFYDGEIPASELNSNIELKSITKKYEVMAKKIEQKYGDIRCIGAFETQPTDLQNYFTYYRGFRWGEAKGDTMMKIALDGIKKMKQLVPKE